MMRQRSAGKQSEFERGLAAALEGHGFGFEYLWNRFSRQVVTFARLQGSEDHEGMANLVFVAAFGKLAQFRGDENAFVALLFSIARNKVIDERRSSGRRVQSTSLAHRQIFGGDVEADAFAGLSDETRRALERLTVDQREVLYLRLVADLPLDSVARLAGRTVGATKALQHRAIAALRKEISEEAVSK